MNFKKGDKVICIKNSSLKSITKHTVYEVRDLSGPRLGLVRDNMNSNTNSWHVAYFRIATPLHQVLFKHD